MELCSPRVTPSTDTFQGNTVKYYLNDPNDLFSKNIILCCFDNIKSKDEG